MKERRNETLLNDETFETIINTTASDIIKVKKEKEGYLSKITEEKEALKYLKKELKNYKKKIKITRRALRDDKKNLRKANEILNIKNNTISQLSNSFISEEKTFIDPTNYSIIKKR